MAFPGTPTRTGYQQTVAGTSWTAFTGVSIPDGSLALFVLALDGGTGSAPTLSGLTGADTDWFPVTDRAISGSPITSQVFYWFNDTGASVNKSLAFAYTQSELASGILLVIPRTTSGLALQVSGTGIFANTSNPNPPLLDIGFTRDVKWIAAVAVDSTVVPTVAPTGFSNLFTQTGVSTASASAATSEQDLAGSSLDPSTFTSASEQYVVWTLAVWEDPPSIKATRFNSYVAVARPSLATSRFNTYVVSTPDSTQDVAPALFTNEQTFFSPTVTQSGPTQTLLPGLFVNSNQFFSARVKICPPPPDWTPGPCPPEPNYTIVC
jgi:hypothetical protein